jgi:hypothetical protein
MKQSLLVNFKLRLVLAVLLSAAGLTVGLLWNGGQELIWAAPGQNPYLQTVPTRSPTPPSESSPAPAPTDQSPEDDDGGDVTPALPPEEATSSPTLPPGEVETSSPTSVMSPTSIAASPTPSVSGPADTVVPSGTATSPEPDSSAVAPATTAVNSGRDTSLFASPLSTPTSVVVSSPLPPSSPIPGSASPGASVQPPQSPIVAPTSATMPGQPPASQPSSEGAGLPIWLYALGLAIILILVGIFLVKRA